MPVETLSEFAERNRISLNTAYTLAARGEIPGAYKVGSQWRIDTSKAAA